MKNFSVLHFICFALLLLIGSVSCRKDREPENPFIPTEFQIVRDLVYAVANDTSGNPVQLKLDLYLPPKLTKDQKFPLVLMFHHGSYLLFNKTAMEEQSRILADSGFIVASIDYRLGWRINGGCEGSINTLAEAEYKAIQDANAARRHLVFYAKTYGIDTAWIFTYGMSAGGAIALNCSYSTDSAMLRLRPGFYEKLGGLNSNGNYFFNNIKIKGICSHSGAVLDSNLIQPSHIIPTICFHGTEDELVPFNTGYFLGCKKVPAFGPRCLYRRLTALNSYCVLYQKTGGKHMPYEYRTEISAPLAAGFFKQVMEGNIKSVIYDQ